MKDREGRFSEEMDAEVRARAESARAKVEKEGGLMEKKWSFARGKSEPYIQIRHDRGGGRTVKGQGGVEYKRSKRLGPGEGYIRARDESARAKAEEEGECGEVLESREEDGVV